METNITLFSNYIHLILWNLNILVYMIRMNYSGNLYIHSKINMLFRNRILNFRFTQQIWQVFRLGLEHVLLYICQTLFLSLLSLTLFSIELAALEILLESKLKGRPVKGDPNKSSYIRHWWLFIELLTAIASNLKTYIKNDWDFTRKSPSLVDYSWVLSSCVVVSL